MSHAINPTVPPMSDPTPSCTNPVAPRSTLVAAATIHPPKKEAAHTTAGMSSHPKNRRIRFPAAFTADS
jgi:hypothetical protein